MSENEPTDFDPFAKVPKPANLSEQAYRDAKALMAKLGVKEPQPGFATLLQLFAMDPAEMRQMRDSWREALRITSPPPP